MKKIFISITLFSLALSASARERSYEEKCRIASSAIGVQAGNRAKAQTGDASAAASLATLSTTVGYTVLGYEQGGFAIVSNDDARTPVLGYSTTDRFDATQPALAWYLSQADAAMAHDATRAAAAVSIPEGCQASVDKLLGNIEWDQVMSPYRDFCPIVLADDVPCVAGCVATAMAQIMACHKYPAQGTGSATITYGGMPYKAYFGEATYDWESMLPSYKSGTSYTAKQRLAVARLIWHCGAAANMSYKKGGSGAYVRDAVEGLQKYFGYQAKYYGYKGQGNYKDAQEWYSVIYKELSHGNPILYSGQAKDGYMHAFVLDGYDADGKVHVNWGYSGSGNGYFDPTVLDMTVNGVTEEFTLWNDMAIIRTPDDDPIDYFSGTTDGISSATVDGAEDDADAPKYNLEGVRVGDNYRGVYIQNGKKRMAK